MTSTSIGVFATVPGTQRQSFHPCGACSSYFRSVIRSIHRLPPEALRLSVPSLRVFFRALTSASEIEWAELEQTERHRGCGSRHPQCPHDPFGRRLAGTSSFVQISTRFLNSDGFSRYFMKSIWSMQTSGRQELRRKRHFESKVGVVQRDDARLPNKSRASRD